MPYAILGWVSTGLLALLILPYILVQINKAFIKGKNKGLLKVIRFLRKLHKPAGIVLLLVAAYHGYLALGSIRLHTGIVLFLFVLATVVLGGSFYRLKDKAFEAAQSAVAFNDCDVSHSLFLPAAVQLRGRIKR